MNIKYYLVKEDHTTNQIIILKQCTKYNGLQEIEELAESIVKKENGNHYLKYYNVNDHNRPYGFYIEKSRLNGVTVKKKFINNGYIFNDVFHQKIISFFLVEEKEKIYKCVDDRYTLYENKAKYDSVMMEFKEVYNIIYGKLNKITKTQVFDIVD